MTITAPARARAATTAWTGVAVAAAALLALLLPAGSPPRVLAILLFACAGAGCGVTCWLDAGDAYLQAAVVLVVSLAGFVLGATVMIWLAAWHPALIVALAAPIGASCVMRLARLRRAAVPA